MFSDPKVSVIIATYSRPYLVGKAIQSVISQTFRDFEVLVISDGDLKETRLSVEAHIRQDPRVKYFGIPRNGRVAAVTNYGLAQAQGIFIAILDDDDSWIDPDKLAKQVNFLGSQPEYVGCGGGYITIDERGISKGQFIKPEQDEEIRRNMLVANPMANSSTIFRRRVAEAIGRYDEAISECADWDFWLRIGHKGKLYNFPEYFIQYRLWSQGLTFLRQRAAAASALRIVWRHRSEYPRFYRALGAALGYNAYAQLPAFIKNPFNEPFSRIKKALFARSSANRSLKG